MRVIVHGRRQMCADSHALSDSSLVHKLLPLKVDPTLGDFVASLSDTCSLQETLFMEEKKPFDAAMAALHQSDVVPEEHFLVHNSACALYSQVLTQVMQTSLVPALTAMHGLWFQGEQDRALLLERLKAAQLVCPQPQQLLPCPCPR
jgi:hypothetical protein